MAKNKNRKQGGPQTRASQAEQAREQAQRTSAEAHESPAANIQGSPADVARKQKKSFGHN
ncbi:hypothetical protein [Streptomyces sp. HUAS TT20]|jgi:hypothetical protein|uniref:hypothetical protein n=1 Tax=Streptomyces sp. HUAS TT20 TaxID=3447509 RepID=UPI0021D91302|nr:hypothetical protein [Streptomyces sp. HUAS 15-9]UXY27011.1 hypothetical protein N8I87_10715 [Streptomyces sp. HUAS 15-9]